VNKSPFGVSRDICEQLVGVVRALDWFIKSAAIVKELCYMYPYQASTGKVQ
jgi:hypothetical protein